MIYRLLRRIADPVRMPIGRALASAGISANFLTVLGLVIVALGSWFVAQGQFVMGGWIVLSGLIFDALDGAVAKAAGEATNAGSFLDSTLDRVADFLLLGAIVFAWAVPDISGVEACPTTGSIFVLCSDGSADIVALGLAAMMMGSLISYIKAKAESLGYECNVGIAERAPRVVILVAGLVLLQTQLLYLSLWLLVVLSTITVLQRFVHVWRQAKVRPN